MSAITFKPEGDLTFNTISGIQDQILKTLKSLEDNTFVFDLSAIEKCDSAGLALLIDTISRLKRRSLNYQFLGVKPDLTSLAKFYEVELLLTDAS